MIILFWLLMAIVLFFVMSGIFVSDDLTSFILYVALVSIIFATGFLGGTLF